MPTSIEINNIVSDSGNFTSSLQVNGTGVSISGHNHTSSHITDFNSSVSGVVSGVYAPLSGATFTGQIIAPSGTYTSNITIGSTNLTTNDILNIINSTNIYLWSNFR